MALNGFNLRTSLGLAGCRITPAPLLIRFEAQHKGKLGASAEIGFGTVEAIAIVQAQQTEHRQVNAYAHTRGTV